MSTQPQWVYLEEERIWLSQEEFQNRLNPPTQILPTIDSTSDQMRAVAPLEFTQDDGSTYRRIAVDQFDDFDQVDSTTIQPTRKAVTARSQNGWSANDRSVVASFTIPGSTRKIALRKGDCSVVLLDIAGWVHANICRIDTGQLDDWGYAERTIRGNSTTLSNHASGTAIDLDALRHPLGVRGSWGQQAAAIRARLKLYEGALRWGEDYTGRPDGMHFEINAGPDLVARIAQKIRGGAPAPAPNRSPQAAPVSRDQELDAMLTGVFHQISGSPVVGEWPGWPSWPGGSGHNLTLVDYIRNSDVLLHEILRQLGALSAQVAELKQQLDG